MKKQKAFGKCIFCGCGNLSKEHFWPTWASELLGHSSPTGAHFDEFVVRTAKSVTLSHTRKERQGHASTKKMRVVCAECNNEWMSILESSVKGFVTLLILGRKVTLTPDMQRALMQWVTLKLMVAEQNRPTEAIWGQSQRSAFLNDRVIPVGLRVWIAQCYSDTWRNAYLRHAATLGKDVADRPRDGAKNSHATVFGIGEAFFLAMGSVAPNVDLGDFFEFDERLVPLWPSQDKNIEWPPSAPLTHDAANRVAMAFQGLMQHQNMIWQP
jgi:hypothetical protein